jgi:regulator of replication initiation timing
VAVVALVTAGLGLWTKRTQGKDTVTVEEVDGSVLAQFLGLTDRVADLEGALAALTLELAETRQQLQQAVEDMAEMQKVEEYLRATLHERDKQLEECMEQKAIEADTLRACVRQLEAQLRAMERDQHGE